MIEINDLEKKKAKNKIAFDINKPINGIDKLELIEPELIEKIEPIKPKHSLSSTQWKLTQESKETWELLYDNHFFDIQEQSISLLPNLVTDLTYYLSEDESMIEILDNQIKILQARKDRFKTRVENIRTSLKHFFDKFDLEKMETPFATVSKVRRIASKLEIEDEGALLMDYPELYIKQEPKLDKMALKTRLEQGEEIKGAKLADTESIMVRR